MPAVILPPTFLPLLAAFEPCFHAPSYRNFAVLVAGWIHCLGRRTITAVAVAAGAVGSRHISVFHRFFGRARWSLDALGRVVFALALGWIPADQPLVLLGDDTLARKSGKGISLATMHHDPLLSTARKPFFSFGHVWVVLALWVPLPMGGTRGFALPLLFRLYVGGKRGGKTDARSRPRAGKRQRAAEVAHAAHPRPTKLELAREMIAVVARWAGDRTLYVGVDSAYAARAILEGRPANVEVISRERMDAALWARPGRRRPGQKGRPRRRGRRLPNLMTMAARRTRWDPLPITIYGRRVTPLVFSCTALWYHALRDQPVRIVVVRDPGGRRRDEAFFCTDLTVGAAFILGAYARRWTLEVSFHDQKQCLGFEDPQNQTGQAVARTAPLAGLIYALVLLWHARQVEQGLATGWAVRPWYRSKTAPSFLDMLTALRQASWQLYVSAPPCPACCRQKVGTPCTNAVPATA
ncbi:MAG TPA: transposase [Chloroflexota bacterium]|nr:transposase [Chloroflexota bacterium]